MRIFIFRPKSNFASDIHLGGVTLSVMLHTVMLHTSLYVQCYLYKGQKNQNKQTRKNKKKKTKKKNKKKEKRFGHVKLGKLAID